jgi:hypothetical protein
VLLADTSGAVVASYIVGGIIWLIIMVITVIVAVRKGHSGFLFFIFSFFCSWIALIVALVIRPRVGYGGANPGQAP